MSTITDLPPMTDSFADLIERLTRASVESPAGTLPEEQSLPPSSSPRSWMEQLTEDEDDSAAGMPLSYEKALRVNTRLTTLLESPAASLNPKARFDPFMPEVAAGPAESKLLPRTPRESQPQRQSQDQKTRTISVRLNEQESEILHIRAAESGMTVSAYLRSCVLEADQLRAQVKQALAELGSRKTQAELPVPSPLPERRPGFFSRLLSFSVAALSFSTPAHRRA
jgi:hypothetical protein